MSRGLGGSSWDLLEGQAAVRAQHVLGQVDGLGFIPSRVPGVALCLYTPWIWGSSFVFGLHLEGVPFAP